MLIRTSSITTKFWQTWISILVVAALIHLVTLSIYPPIWQDEVMIIDYGRSFLEPNTSWSLNWNLLRGKAYITPFYLGSVLHELAFRLAGLNVHGPRLLSIIGSSASATFAILWLDQWRLRKWVLLAIGSTFLLDPLHVTSYRGDRFDAWILCAAFASLWLIRIFTQNVGFSIYNVRLLWLAGAAAAVGMTLWINFIYLIPLVLWELWVASSSRTGIPKIHTFAAVMANFMVGFGTVFLVLQLPVIARSPWAYVDQYVQVAVTVHQPGLGSLIEFPNLFVRNPALPLLALIACVIRFNMMLVVISIIAIFFIFSRGAYQFSAIYALPYFLAMIAGAFSPGERPPNPLKTTLLRSAHILLAVSLLSSFIYSLILLPAHSLARQSSLQPAIIDSIATRTIGSGSYKVYITSPYTTAPFEIYPAGRRLGWKIYKNHHGEFSQDQINAMDFVISRQSSIPGVAPDHFDLVGSFLEDSSGVTLPGGYKSYGPIYIYANKHLGITP